MQGAMTAVEQAAQGLALPSLRANAEATLLEFRRSPHALPACRHILEHSQVTEAQFQAASTLRDAALRDWTALPPQERSGLRQFCLGALLHRTPPPAPVVASQLMSTLAVILKRAWLDDGVDRGAMLSEAEAAVKSGEPLLLEGRALIDDIDDDGQQMMPKMRATQVTCLADEQMARTRRVDITIEVPVKTQRPYDEDEMPFDPRRDECAEWDAADDKAVDIVQEIRNICETHRGDRPVSLKLMMPAGYTVEMSADEATRIAPTEEFIQALERVRGVEKVVRV